MTRQNHSPHFLHRTPPDLIRIDRANVRLYAAMLLCFIALVVWYFSTPYRMIADARQMAVRYQPKILEEAQAMLDAAAAAGGSQHINYDDFSDQAMPPHIAKLGGHTASVSPRYPGAVKVSVTGGFTHFGLYLIPNPTTATENLLRNFKTKKINDHILQFDDEG